MKYLVSIIVFALVFFGGASVFAQFGTIYNVAGFGTGMGGGAFGIGDGMIADSAVLSWSAVLCVDNDRNIYIADNGHYRVRKINFLTGIITTIAGTGYQGFSGDGGDAAFAQIGYVSGICSDKNNNIYIYDYYNSRVRKIDKITHIIATVAGNGSHYFSGDGGSATSAGLYDLWYFSSWSGPSAPPTGCNQVWVDKNNTIYITVFNKIRKIDTFGIITTIAGQNTIGFDGDGGAATSSQLNGAIGIIGDTFGNIYFADCVNNRIRKIDSNGIITTIAGNGDNYYYSWFSYMGADYFYTGDDYQCFYYGDGGPATAAQVNNPHYISIDGNRNLFISKNGDQPFGGSVIRKVDAQTGIINVVAGRPSGDCYSCDFELGVPSFFSPLWGNSYVYFGANAIAMHDSDVLYYILQSNTSLFYVNSKLRKVVHPISGFVSYSVSDSLTDTSCAFPQKVYFGLRGKINGTPTSTDSLIVAINYRDGSAVEEFKLPYWYIIGSLGDTTWGFGDSANTAFSHLYYFPSYFSPTITLQSLHYCQSKAMAPTFLVRNNCDTTITSVHITSFVDSIISPPCTGGTVRLNVKGFVTGTAIPTDSVYVIIQYDDGTFDVNKAPLTLVGSNYFFDYTHYRYYPHYEYQQKVYVVGPSGIGADSANSTTFKVDDCSTGYFKYGYCYNYDSVLAFSYYLYSPGYGFVWDGWCNNSWYGEYCTGSCNNSGYNYDYNCDTYDFYGFNVVSVCNYPDTEQLCLYGPRLFGSMAAATSITQTLHFGDGTDTTIIYNTINGDGFGDYWAASGFMYVNHAYTTSGIYRAYIETTAAGYTQFDTVAIFDVGSCATIAGSFYIDTNHNCILDPGEVRLGYEPYAIVYNAIGDTNYYWTNDSGRYSINLPTGQDYTIIPNCYSYLGAFEYDSLSISCPSSGIYTVTPLVASTTITENFGFNCISPTTIDMSVSGWEWGVVPGDTGIICVWSSNLLGYNCDTLTSTITLTIDTLLTYQGMWTGPPPTTVSGRVLIWVFGTYNDLFDFEAFVKVTCSTTATMGSLVTNTMSVTPTALPDPDTVNNFYTWTEPVTSSWDPNEKQVSPQGVGPNGYIPNGQPLSYMIHFQNTGTAPASNIVILDTISSHLNFASIQLTSSIAPVQLTQVADHVVKFTFSNINLPDSTVSRLGSIGYVGYNILPYDSLPNGTQITNEAGIYFDYNPVVVTNATINTIMDTLAPISGSNEVCLGAYDTLVNAQSGGVWHVTNNNASISQSGLLTGLHIGYDTVTYTFGTYLSVSKVVFVSPLPNVSAISGPSLICVGTPVMVTDTILSGTWSVSNAHAAISLSGVVSGASVGLDTIYFISTNYCGTAVASKPITVNMLLDAGIITGPTTICQGNYLTLTDAAIGGVWALSNTLATITSTGITHAVNPGVDTVYYTATNTCGTSTASKTFTINPAPVSGTITGTTDICAGTSTTLVASVPGGNWYCTNALAAISGGVATGVSAGLDTVSYLVTNSCGTAVTRFPLTITPIPASGVLLGADSLCVGAIVRLTPSAPGGTWATSNTNASVAAGHVLGTFSGMDTIIYTVTNICGTATTSKSISVKPLPFAGTITGTDSLCGGAATSLIDAATGGVFMSRDTSLARITLGGFVTAMGGTGLDTVKYAVTNFCGTSTANKLLYIHQAPHLGNIAGHDSVCSGATVTLTDSISGGTWACTNPKAYNFGNVVFGLLGGLDTVTYTITNTCGTTTKQLPIYILTPLVSSPVAGPANLCIGNSATLTNANLGGSWASQNSSIASVATASGIVTGIGQGSDSIIYTVSNICGSALSIFVLNVDSTPVLTITGGNLVCIGGNQDTLYGNPVGGSWSVSNANAGLATIGTDAVVSGNNPGPDTVTYHFSNVCGSFNSSATIHVYSLYSCDFILYVQATIGNTLSLSQFKTIPNPNPGYFTVVVPVAGDGYIVVTDLVGKEIARAITSTAYGNLIAFDLKGIASGTYFIKAIVAGRTYREKVVVEKQ